MFKRFSGGGGEETSWPVAKIVAALEAQYGAVEQLGEDGPLKVYGVQDHGLNFVVALLQSAPGSNQAVEIGFLARFVGFPVDAQLVENLNRNMHISIASLEGTDLFLMAGVQILGAYDEAKFMLLLEAWRRDLMMTMHGLSGESASFAAAFPAAKMKEAVSFATNAMPDRPDFNPSEMLSNFLGAQAASKAICDDCHGRGKRGLIARMCDACDGTGFVTRRR